MKTWINADVVELNIAATAQGGSNLQQVDAYWTEKDTGNPYASYASGAGEIPGSNGEIDNPLE